MLVIYLIALIAGGGLVLLSIVAGADHGDHGGDLASHGLGGHGHGSGGHGHGGHDGQGDAANHTPAIDVVLSWLPVGSLRFWTFFAAFFGLSGTVMTVLGAAGSVPIAVAASAVGYGSGLLLVRTLLHLQRHSADSSVAESDLVGASADVLVPVAPGRTGKVRAHLKGRAVDLLAESEESEMAIGERVLVIGVTGAGRALVARAGVPS